MTDTKVTATAMVEVMLKVSCTQPWSGSESVENIHKRARSEAIEKVSRLVQGDNDIFINGNDIKIQVITFMESK